MKIEFSSNDNVDGCDSIAERMTVYDKDGKNIGGEYVGPLFECPEDAIIGRSLVSCGEIIEYMKKAYEAGKNGEEFIVENVEWRG